MKFVVEINDEHRGQQLANVLRKLAKDIEFTEFGDDAVHFASVAVLKDGADNCVDGSAYFTSD